MTRHSRDAYRAQGWAKRCGRNYSIGARGFIAQLQSNGDHVKRLADAYLKKKGLAA
ncbi:MAG TPA: hypothetical protein VKY73_14035 [Polyangiaceae bacterium]|nr:hypothetical protein [Polyangiaceae bacterium]